MTAIGIGCIPGRNHLRMKAEMAALAAAVQSFAVYTTGKPVGPMRRFKVRLNKANSTQPETPADAVSPATPHFGSRPMSGGNGIAQKYPRTAVSVTRTVA